MIPFRNFCVAVVTALTLTIMALLLKGGTINYVIVRLSFCMTAYLLCLLLVRLIISFSGSGVAESLLTVYMSKNQSVVMCHEPSSLQQHIVRVGQYLDQSLASTCMNAACVLPNKTAEVLMSVLFSCFINMPCAVYELHFAILLEAFASLCVCAFCFGF